MKNTGFMAMRMFLSMAVALYTSRVVLQQLGVEDFGIYSVVAGLALIMSFFTNSLTAALQRYMNVELAVTKGKGMQEVFAASWGCVLAMSVIFIIIAELAGLWFLEHKLNIPLGRMGDAKIVFQLSMVIVIIEMLRVPYSSLIIAHEKMSFYAYNSIIEVGLKLTLAILLSITMGNKLLIYMWMLIGVAIIINASYVIYCRIILPTLRFRLKADIKKIVEIGKFAGWNVITSLSDVSYQQGTSMILNIFYGVALNATMGIANQIKIAVTSFTRSLQTAANPQIIQTFAAGSFVEFKALFIRISKMSFFCVAFVGVPIFLNAEFLLSIWLSIVPPAGAVFAKLIIIFCMVDSLVGPLWVTMQASGRIALYQITISLVWLLCLPLTYFAYKWGMPSYSLIAVMIIIDSILIIIRVIFTEKYCNIRAADYFKEVIIKILCALAVGLLLPITLKAFVNVSDIASFFITSTAWVITMGVAIYYIGLTYSERISVNSFLKKFIIR